MTLSIRLSCSGVNWQQAKDSQASGWGSAAGTAGLLLCFFLENHDLSDETGSPERWANQISVIISSMLIGRVDSITSA